VDIARDGVAERIPGQRDERAQHTTEQTPYGPAAGPEPVDTPWQPPAEIPPHVSALRPPPEPLAPAPEPVDRRRLVAVHLAWAIPALTMLALGLYRISGPSLWGDELLTWGIIELNWPDFRALSTEFVTPVMPYYLFMRGWTAVVGTSDAALRLPSVLAAVGAVALVARIGTRLATPLTGLTAGLLMAVVPAMSRYAQEARPYTLTIFLAVLATVVFLQILDRPAIWRLIAYTAAIAFLGLFHFFALGLLLAHGAWLLLTRRDLLLRWGIAAVIGCLPSIPVVWYGMGQRDAVAWIANSTVSSPVSFFGGLFGAMSVTSAVAALAVLSFSRDRKVLMLVLWGVLPLVALYVAGLIFGSVWLARYMLFVTPAWVLLAALTMVRFRVAATAAALVVVGLVGVPVQRDWRADDGHGLGAEQAAKIIADRYQPGDVVVYGATGPGQIQSTRDLVNHYVPADRRPPEPLLVRAPRTDGKVYPDMCSNISGCLKNPPRIWIVRLGAPANPVRDVGPGYDSVLRNYVVQERWNPRGLTIALLTSNRL
jgi:mannosyltransferase